MDKSIPNHVLAYKDYKNGSKYKEIAEKYSVSIDTVKSWKQRYNWMREKGVHTKAEKVCTQNTPPSSPSEPTLSPEGKRAIEEIVENSDLSPKQLEFCILCANKKNQTRAYQQVYGCTYNAARSSAAALVAKPNIRAEIKRLKKILFENHLFELEDLIEFHIRVLRSDINDFVTFGVDKKPYTHNGMPVTIEDPNDLDKLGRPKQKQLVHDANYVWFRDCEEVDGSLISEISVGKDGAKVKLFDKHKSAEFLARYFEAFPMDKHKKEYDAMRVEIELLKLQANLPSSSDDSDTPKSNFDEALGAAAKEVWDDEDHKE